MKKLILQMFAAACLLAFSGGVRAQGFLSLQVIAMPGYPVLPADTAYQGQLYAFDIVVINGTNLTVNSPITINLKVDSVTTVVGTSPVNPPLPPGDTLILNISQYGFNPNVYKTGNNIVVVWPVVNGLVVPIDSFYADVFFVPLNSLGQPEEQMADIHIYPTQATQWIFLDRPRLDDVEYVRIWTVNGTLVREIRAPQNRQIDVAALSQGLYFLEVQTTSGSGYSKFQKQ